MIMIYIHWYNIKCGRRPKNAWLQSVRHLVWWKRFSTNNFGFRQICGAYENRDVNPDQSREYNSAETWQKFQNHQNCPPQKEINSHLWILGWLSSGIQLLPLIIKIIYILVCSRQSFIADIKQSYLFYFIKTVAGL